MRFTKFHGYGNDYLVFEADELRGVGLSPGFERVGAGEPFFEFVRRVCERHFGAGSDGIAVRPGATWELPEGSRAYLLDLLAGGGVGLHIQYLDLLFRTLHDLSETPRTAFGDGGRDLSGAALEVEVQPLVQKWADRLTYVVEADATDEDALRQLGIADFPRAERHASTSARIDGSYQKLNRTPKRRDSPGHRWGTGPCRNWSRRSATARTAAS